MKSIEEAKIYARKKHVGQMYGNYYYDKHLHDVSHVLTEFGFSKNSSPVLHIAAYLHDILEDTGTSYNDIKKRFEELAAEIVYALTDELGRNRKERADKTHPKIKGFLEATIIKLADRIANSRESKRTGSDLYKMYKKEFKSFKEHLYYDFGDERVDNMWNELENILN